MLLLHGFEGAHATIALELTTVVDDRVARTLFRTSDERTHHHAAATSGEGLHDITGVAQTTISDEGNTCSFQHAVDIIDGAELWHTHTSHHTGGTDGTWADTHLDGVGTIVNQHLRSLTRSNITYDDVDIGEHLLSLDEFLDHRLRMTMGRVDDDGISAGIDKSLHTVEGIGCHTHTSCHTQTSFLVLAGHRLILGLGDILIGDKSDETVILVNNGQFLNLILLQNLCCCHQVSLLMGCHEMVFRHNLLHRTIQTALETKVTVGDDAYEVLLIIDHGDTADMIL